MKGELPTFLVIGAMKCGTTSLHDYLNCHPDIFMSKQKELNYFLTEFNFLKGEKWYREQFQTDKPVRGESSPGYSKFHVYEGVPERIKKLIPNVKFIYIVRNPVERFVSHIHEAIALGNRENGFDPNTQLSKNLESSNYTLSGMYALQLEKYLPFFSIDRFKVISVENLKTSTIETMNELFRFLEVRELPIEFEFPGSKNTFKEKYTRSNLGKAIMNLAKTSLMRRILSQDFKSNLKRNSLYKKYSVEKVKKVELSNQTIKCLEEIYSADLDRFEEILGHPVKGLKL